MVGFHTHQGTLTTPMAQDAHAAYERLKSKLKMQLADVLDDGRHPGQVTAQRGELEADLRQIVRALPEEFRDLNLGPPERERLVQEVIDEVTSLGPFDHLLTDPDISEIMVNGPSDIFVERRGRIQRFEGSFRNTDHLMFIIERLLGGAGLSVNEAEPICDGTLPDGARINVIIPPLVLNGPVVTIRRKIREWAMPEYLATGALNEQAAQFLQACVRAKVNIVISGGTSTGKTTLVTVLSDCIPHDQRIITIENVAELELAGREHWIRMVAKTANLEGRGEIPLRALVKNALRMRPDRIILGEARGGEALDVVQAMHSGHDGFMTVLHANSARGALERLETLMLMSGIDLSPSACRMQIAGAVDLVVHMVRFADGTRRVGTIAQVLGSSTEGGFHLEDLFAFQAEGFGPDGRLKGSVRYTEVTPRFLSKFHLNNVEVPAWVTT